jgi:hypothetical protein
MKLSLTLFLVLPLSVVARLGAVVEGEVCD